MPEIGEVARIVHFIRKHLVGKTLAIVKAQHDEIVFGKVGTSAAEFEKSLTGKKVIDARQQGKYFWLVMSSPPHPLCHFGMAGWFEIRHEDTSYHKSTKPKDLSWPPKYWKFTFESAEEPKCEAAFVDFRRLARIRLIDCAAEDIRHLSPLKENGPDPVIDKEVLTEQWLSEKLASKKLHVKTFLLDQANISGIGNWVGDEILYHAAIHPETNTRDLSTGQISRLYESLHEVSSLAVSTHADPGKFPDTWLFKHRWGKGKKDSPDVLLNGAKISFITVGGRTTAVVASVQKKTEVFAGPEEVRDEPEKPAEGNQDEDEEKTKPKKSGARKLLPGTEGNSRGMLNVEEETTKPKKSRARKRFPGTEWMTDTEVEPETAKELPETTTTTTPAKKSHRKNRAVKKEVGQPTPEHTDTKIETNSAPTSVASKKRKAKTEAPPPEPGPTTATGAASPPSKKQKATPSRSATEHPTQPAVSTEPMTSPQAKKKTKAAAKGGETDKKQKNAKGVAAAGAAEGETGGGEIRRRSRRVSGRAPG